MCDIFAITTGKRTELIKALEQVEQVGVAYAAYVQRCHNLLGYALVPPVHLSVLHASLTSMHKVLEGLQARASVPGE